MRKPAKPEKPEKTNEAPRLQPLDDKQLEGVTGGDGKGGAYYGNN